MTARIPSTGEQDAVDTGHLPEDGEHLRAYAVADQSVSVKGTSSARNRRAARQRSATSCRLSDQGFCSGIGVRSAALISFRASGDAHVVNSPSFLRPALEGVAGRRNRHPKGGHCPRGGQPCLPGTPPVGPPPSRLVTVPGLYGDEPRNSLAEVSPARPSAACAPDEHRTHLEIHPLPVHRFCPSTAKAIARRGTHGPEPGGVQHVVSGDQAPFPDRLAVRPGQPVADRRVVVARGRCRAASVG